MAAKCIPQHHPPCNNSDFEIRKKRFRFTYPPKELRAHLLATPPRAQGRALRLSMIHTAEVFSPRPSRDPRENLRVLQSPLKPRAPQGGYGASDTKPIILVDGNHPRVVEEDRDLVILEDVQVSSPQLQPPSRAPRYTSTGGGRIEELEVLDVVAEPIAGLQAGADMKYSSDDDDQEGDMEVDMDEDGLTDGDEEDEGQDADTVEQKSTWRKSLERIWPFRSSSQPPADESDHEEADGGVYPSSSEPEDDPTPRKLQRQHTPSDSDEEAEERSAGPKTPIRRALGSFMTPQAQPNTFAESKRYSMGGGEPQRVPIVESKWRVQDIVVPLKSPARTNISAANTPSPALKSTPVGRRVIDEAEKKAIQERRRSAGSASPTKKNVPAPPSLKEEEEEEMDTRSLLEKMKETVEGMKRRRTSVFGLAGTPLLAIELTTLGRPTAAGIDEDINIENNEIATEDPIAPQESPSEDQPHSRNDDAFSLLRPGFGISTTPAPVKEYDAGESMDYEMDSTVATQIPSADMILPPSPAPRGTIRQNPELAETEDERMPEDVPEKRQPYDAPVAPTRRTTRKTTAEPDRRHIRYPSSHKKRPQTSIRNQGDSPPATRKPAEPPSSPKEESAAPPPVPVRRGRKPTVEPQPDLLRNPKGYSRTGRTSSRDPSPAKRSGRRTPVEGATPAARATAKTPKSAPAAVRRGARGKPIEVEVDEAAEDDDPLDTINASPAVKEETDEPAVVPKRGRSAAKAAAGAKASGDTSKIPTRSRSTRKIATPEKEASTQSDDEAAPDEEVEKVRVSRSKKPAARGRLTKVKEEADDSGPKETGRVTRTAARTRTKTT
ncbi:hypothetical protein BD779DRAFT_1676198 [Infundibulicybe gibba]|nr:hypothetical protein BD779DRAFT_1676198 [Infundibulicybe gibba]